jgi:hypothetical protein
MQQDLHPEVFDATVLTIHGAFDTMRISIEGGIMFNDDWRYGTPKVEPFSLDEVAARAQEVLRLHKIAMDAIPIYRTALSDFAPRVERLFRDELVDRFPGVRFYVQGDMECGCMCADWAPYVNIYHVEDVILYDDGNWYKQRWDLTLNDYDSRYTPVALQAVAAPVDVERLREFLTEFEAATGVLSTLSVTEMEEGQQIVMEDEE